MHEVLAMTPSLLTLLELKDVDWIVDINAINAPVYLTEPQLDFVTVVLISSIKWWFLFFNLACGTHPGTWNVFLVRYV